MIIQGYLVCVGYTSLFMIVEGVAIAFIIHSVYIPSLPTKEWPTTNLELIFNQNFNHWLKKNFSWDSLLRDYWMPWYRYRLVECFLENYDS